MDNQVTTTTKQSLATLVKTPNVRAKFASTLGEENVDSFLAGVVSVINSNASFKDVEPMSVLGGAMVASQLGVSIIPALGLAALVPYNNKGRKQAQFQIMTNGLVQLAMRSGQVESLNACVIYADEFNGFDKIRGELKPLKDHDESCTEVVGYCAYVRLVNGGEHTEYWSKAKVEQHARKYSKSLSFGPWKDNFDAMAKKTVLKYLINHYCPKETKMAKAVSSDQAVVNFDDIDAPIYVDVPEEVEVQFSEAESKERLELLSRLCSVTNQENIVKSTKGARSIDDVPTQRLRDLAKEWAD